MSWRIEILPSAEKQYPKLDATTRRRIKSALQELQRAERPLIHPRVRPLTGRLRGDHRVRVGGWRLLMTPDRDAHILRVFVILPCGDAY